MRDKAGFQRCQASGSGRKIIHGTGRMTLGASARRWTQQSRAGLPAAGTRSPLQVTASCICNLC